ncbi:MAG TPA: CARDB domain-containing protein [Baekduia sp.]|nr:CARDB domain-containing protein [Baekduia sp.]
MARPLAAPSSEHDGGGGGALRAPRRHRRAAVLAGATALGAGLLVTAPAGAGPIVHHHSATIAAARPDLTIKAVKAAKRSIRAGSRVRLTVAVRDAGPGRAGASRTTLFLSLDGIPDPRDLRLATISTHALKPHHAARRKLRVRIPTGASGTYRVIACADSASRIGEADETNNCRASKRTLRVTATGAAPNGPAANPNGDADGDGSRNGVDCAPNDPAIHPGAQDLPDVPGFVDTNCDGIDGDAAKAIFVSAIGSDTNAGTRTKPMKTIGAGVAAALAQAKDVYVTQGEYPETVTISGGVSIYGGYDFPAWSRARTNATRITGDASGSARGTGMIAMSVIAPTTLQLLTLQPSAPTEPDRTSYGIRGASSPGLHVELATITAAKGTAGDAGQTGLHGATGGDGQPGSKGGDGGTSAARNTGGKGGSGGSDGAGGPGAPGLPTTADALGRMGGPGGAGGAVGHVGGAGYAGDSGVLGADGDGGGPANVLPPNLGRWQGENGGYGQPGTDGDGGGGGGGGGAEDCFCLFPDDGGHGGGGGGGGQAGSGGVGGRAGGGSIGIYLPLSTGATVRDSSVTAADGAPGGAGGLGAQGGIGGKGGAGATSGNGAKGGNGGLGGVGGRGGDGGGGAGGPSIAIVGLTPTAITTTALQHGTGGAGGARGAGALHGGGVGVTGVAQDLL